MSARDQIEEGAALGPRLLLAGRLLSAPTPAVRYYPGMYEVARGSGDLRRAVRGQVERGADVIKVMASGAMLSPEDEDAEEAQLTRQNLQAVVEASHSLGRLVAAHAHAASGVRNAVDAGVASIEHGTFADRETLERMADRGTFLVPTIAASASMVREEGVMERMPRHLRDRLVRTHETHLEMIRSAHDVGVPIAMGTDAGTPGNHHGANAWECVYLVSEAGLPSSSAIEAATTAAAKLLGREGEIGILKQGARADVVGFESNPLEDISVMTRPRFVMRGGVVVRDDRIRARSESQ